MVDTVNVLFIKSTFKYVVFWLSILFLLGIMMTAYFVIIFTSDSLEDKPMFHIERELKKFETKLNYTTKKPTFILNTKGCKIIKQNVSSKSANSTTQSTWIFRAIQGDVVPHNCPVPLTFLDTQKNLIFKVEDSIFYSNFSCCASFWTSSNSFKRRTECKDVGDMDSMMGKEFIKIKCCYKWMNILTECQQDIHANVPLSDVVKKKIEFWEQRMPHFNGLPPNVLVIRFKIPKSHRMIESPKDGNEQLSRLQFVPIGSFFHRGMRSGYPFYTKAKVNMGKGIENKKLNTNNTEKLTKKSPNSDGKKSLVRLLSSVNNYVTFSVVGNRSMEKLNKQKFDYNFANFLHGIVDKNCIGNLSVEEYALEYAARLIETFPTTPFFGSVILDDPSEKSKSVLIRFLENMLVQRHIIEKTLIVLQEDPDVHDQNPSALLIRLPNSITEKEVYSMEILNVNKNRLVTSSDLHQSLIGIFKMGCHSRRFKEVDYRKKCSLEVQNIPRGFNLWKSVISGNRNCSEAGIVQHFCPCLA